MINKKCKEKCKRYWERLIFDLFNQKRIKWIKVNKDKNFYLQIIFIDKIFI